MTRWRLEALLKGENGVASSAMWMRQRKCTYLALLARASWNSYDHRCPVDPIVRATEWVNDPDPVPVFDTTGKGALLSVGQTTDVAGTYL